MEPLQLVLREGHTEARPLAQVEAQLADSLLQQGPRGEGPVSVSSGTWLITLDELRAIVETLAQRRLQLQVLISAEPRTRVAAAALGIRWRAPATVAPASSEAQVGLRVHQGTVRAGEQLNSDGSLLVLGDVNPGARVIAAGHVLVWGTLRGVAHAGCLGERGARIIALQLRPLQLRIADAVARGPEEPPIVGFAEQAELIDGLIAIRPAAPQWPLATPR